MSLRTKFYTVSETVKKLVPRSVFMFVRGIGTAVIAPISFSYRTGHLRSSLLAKAVDKNGQPLLWYSFPASDFLEWKDFSGKRILEFGAGQSTLWWAKRAQEVIAFEYDPEWYDYLRQNIPENVKLHLVSRDIPDISEYVADKTCDIVVVDGFDRFECAKKALNLVTENGAVIVDDSQGHWGAEGEYPIIDLFRSAEFSRIDFYGYTPGTILPNCTSVFFKDRCFLLNGTENPVMKIPNH